MIRINLLPVRQERIQQYGKQQLFLGLLVIGLVCTGFFVHHSGNQSVLDERMEEISLIEQQVAQLETRTAELERLSTEKAQLETLASTLQVLDANRAGPVLVMDELRVMLNEAPNDLQRVAQTLNQWDVDWEPRNLWITNFTESGGRLALTGKAMNNDDIAEFTIRLSRSPYFDNVQLNSTKQGTQSGLGAVFEFAIEARVNYGLIPSEEG